MQGSTDTWEDSSSGTLYEYDPSTEDLTISGGSLGSGNQIVVDDFNIGAATGSSTDATGTLDLSFADQVFLTSGATDGSDPPTVTFTAGSAQSYTVSVDAPTSGPQTVTVTLTGVPTADFSLISGTTTIPLNSDGMFTVTIPAGETSASFTLVNSGDVGSNASLQLVASISEPNNQNDTLSSTSLTQSYVEPAQDPFQTPVVPQLYYYGAAMVNGASVGEYQDVQQNGEGTAVTSIAGGSAFINLDGEGGESINGGAGSDTIIGAFVTPENVNGGVGQVSAINANGGQDIIAIGDPFYTYQDQVPPVAIYGNSAEDLTQAVADAENGAATHEQGDLISTSTDDSTIVGGNGNDLIMSASNGVIVAGPGDDTIAGGGSLDYTNSLMGATWSASVTGNQLSLSDGMYLQTSATTYSYSNYQGNFDSSGYALGTSNQTIFGGAGNDVILLSNGDNEVNLGSGDSTVFGGMGSNTISGGAGNDSIVGGGGSDYIETGTGNDFVAGYGGNNTIFGGSGTDTLFAGDGDSNWATEETAGDNYVQAGSGNTLIYGSGGNDTLLGGSGADTINAGDGNESIVAGSGNTSINGGNGPDTIVAGSGSDTIWGSTQSTTIYGGTGTDDILGTTGTDVIYAGDGGTSQAPTGVTAGSGDTTIYGGEGVDQIWGGDGNDVIYAGDGGAAQAATQVFAGSGNTTIYGGDGTDNIIGGSGTDVLYAGDGGGEGSPTYVTAGTGTATLYGGAGASVLTDNQGGNDVLEAGSGDTALYGVGQDTLIAGSGANYLAGGSGSTYVFGSNVSVVEVASAGSGTLEFTSSVDSSDIALSAVLDSGGAGSLTIGEGGGSITVDGALSDANKIDSVVFDDPQSESLTQFIQQEASLGNATATTVAGANGNLIFDVANGDVVSGGSGQDTISAWGNNDTLTAGSGGGEICAEGTDDLVTGGSGNDTLDAVGAGVTLIGGTGSEVFEVNDTSDVVEAQADADSNAIISSVNYTLSTGVDVLTLTGAANLSATGNNDAGNVITGNAGDDTLIAGSGSDTLTSGTGVDTLFGGDGPDTFVVNNSADVIELASYQGWHDTVESTVSFELTASAATLDLVGSGDLSVRADYSGTEITGNTGNDTLIGDSGFDTFVGGAGVDTFEAGGDNNVFVVNNADDVIQLDSGENDTVESSVSYTLGQGVDALMLTGAEALEGQGNADASNLIEGNSGDDTLIAGSGSDTLVAGSGSDTLVAGSGTDVLEGGTGSTTYAFDSSFGQAEIEQGSGSGTIAFGAGITASDLTVGLTTDSNGNPALLIQDGSSEVTVDGGLGGSVGSFEFADGTQLTLGGLLTEATVTPGTLAGTNGNAILSTTLDASLSGGYGNDSILGTGASDTLTAGSGNQYLLGAGDDDSITGAFGNDTLVGDGANDTLVAGNGDQELYGLGRGDILVGGMGDDTLYGGAGNDTFVSGTGGTVIHGGNTGDSLVLTEGANVTFYPSSTSGVELIQLPGQMTLADFSSYEGAGGDLILQSLSGDTTAVIEGFFSSTNEKTWLVTDSTGTTQSLSTWVSSNQQPPSNYQAQIEGLEQAYAADLPAILNQVGQQGGTIAYPGSVLTQTSQNQYQFDGVTTENLAVQGGVLNLGSSEDEHYTSTTLQTGSTTYTETVPQYSEVTIPGSTSFIPDSSLDSLDQSNMQNEVGGNGGFSVEEGTGANGEPGYTVTMLPYSEEEQTGTRTIVETVPTYTTYSQTTQGFVDYNVTGDGGNDVINARGPFVGTVVTGNGNVSLDLGLQNGGVDYYYPQELALGAFIDAGSANDSIIGSGGPDTIAAGTGYDYIEAGFGSTVYVPLQGTSTEEIDIEPPFYGFGPLPRSTLVLPNGITPGDLQYRLVSYGPSPNDSDGQAEALQISYGDSSVLIDFIAGPPPDTGNIQNVPSDDWNGIDQFQFSNGSVLTRDQILAMAGSAISASALNPTVTALNPTVSPDSTITGDTLFSGSDSSGSQITWYQISNSGAGGAYFTLDGVEQTPGQTFFVNSDQLSQLEYIAGTEGSTDAIQASAFDGLVWGNTTTFNVSPTASVYQATGADEEVTGSTSGPDTLVGGYGGDTLVGSSGQDTFEYNAGGGAERISETSPVTSTSDNVLEFGSGITPATLTLAAAGSELVLSTGASGDSVSIEGFNPLNPLQSFPIQSFAFPDGESLTLLQLLSDAAVTGTSGSITNADGSTSSYQFTPSDQQIYYAQNVNTLGQLMASVSLDADGSEETNSYIYNADGSYTQTEVATTAGGGSTTTVNGFDTSGSLVSQQVQNQDGSSTSQSWNAQGETLTYDVTNADGSTNDSSDVYNADGSYTDTNIVTPAGGGTPTTTVIDYNNQGLSTSVDVTNPDGSTNNSTYTYNSDGSYMDINVVTPEGGGTPTTAVIDYNSQGLSTSIDVTNPDGSTNDSTYTYNADGSYTDTNIVTPAGGGAPTTTVIGYNILGLSTSIDITNPDGSTNDSTYAYSADGSYTETDVATPAGGGAPTTAVIDYDSQGLSTSIDVTNPDGSTNDSAYAYNADGSYTETDVVTPAGGGASTTTVTDYNAQGLSTSIDITNPDGSTNDSTYTYNADGTYTEIDVVTPLGGAGATTTVIDYNAQGNSTSENAYTLSADGSYTDSWSQADGSHGTYWWSASTSTYEDTWYDSNGSSWTDEYQYASGGSPGAAGYSFVETYSASDGSTGSRQYDASTGVITLSWDSAATGQLSGTITDSGFIGLQNDGELTNTQQDLTFFNPNVSSSFSAFLATH